ATPHTYTPSLHDALPIYHPFARAMARLDPVRRQSAELELLTVLNSALVADAVLPHDTDAVRDALDAVHRTLSLGLEHLAGGDEERAAHHLEQAAVKRIFQIGFTRVLQIRWRADRMRKELPLEIDRGAFLADGLLGQRLEALFRRRPRYADAKGKVRAFTTLEELAEVSADLDAIEATARAFRDAGFTSDPTRAMVVHAWGDAGLARVRYSDLFLTRLARVLVGLSPSWEALPADRLAEAARASFSHEGRVLPAAIEAAHDLLDAPSFVAGALAD